MTSPQRSIYVGPAFQALLARRRPDESLTGTVAQAAACYLAICRSALPEFDQNEWCAILDALNGIGLSLEDPSRVELTIRSIPHEVADAERIHNLSAKWQVDGPGLVERLGLLTFAELAAVAEVAECFWVHPEEETSEALRRALESW